MYTEVMLVFSLIRELPEN